MLRVMVDPGDVPTNAPLLSWLRSQAVAGGGTGYEIDAWELHTHPDLVDRLRELAPEGSFVPMYGVPTLVHPSGVVFAYAIGTSGLVVREAIPLPDGVRTDVPYPRLDGWVSLEPWPVDIEMRAGTALLRRFLRDLSASLA
jgi:hypothetical protein